MDVAKTEAIKALLCKAEEAGSACAWVKVSFSAQEVLASTSQVTDGYRAERVDAIESS